MVKLVRVSGFSGSGKTMLVTALVEELTGQGITVATVKHHGGHGHGKPLDGADKKVKDTDHHRNAGAVASFLISPDSLTIFDDSDQKTRIERAVDLCPPGVQLVILEGFKTLKGIPWIAVRREGFELVPINGEEQPLCVVTDEKGLKTDAPLFTHADIGEIAALLKTRVLGDSR